MADIPRRRVSGLSTKPGGFAIWRAFLRAGPLARLVAASPVVSLLRCKGFQNKGISDWAPMSMALLGRKEVEGRSGRIPQLVEQLTLDGSPDRKRSGEQVSKSGNPHSSAGGNPEPSPARGRCRD